jgi:hypothetical protein
MPNSRVDRPRRGPNNLFADVCSVALLALVLLGVVGLGYRALRPGGWLGSGLDYLWEKGPGLVWMGGFALVLGGAAVKRILFPRRAAAHQGDLWLYFCVALGLFFLFRLLVTGSL